MIKQELYGSQVEERHDAYDNACVYVRHGIPFINFCNRNNGNGDDRNIEACTALHEKWQAHHRTWFTSNLAEAEHKLLLADEGWRSARAK